MTVRSKKDWQQLGEEGRRGEDAADGKEAARDREEDQLVSGPRWIILLEGDLVVDELELGVQVDGAE